MSQKKVTINEESRRRLSPWRVLFALLMLGGIVTGGIFGSMYIKAMQSKTSTDPWFAGYVDVTAMPTFAFEQIGSTEHRDTILSFIVASPKGDCTPSWGGAYTLDQAGTVLDLDRRIARLQQQDGTIAISFGGLKNNELAVKCHDVAKLKAAYASVVERYNIDTIDLDLENNGLNDAEASTRRAEAIAQLQAERRASGKHLAVWLTIPVAPQGLTEAGTNAVSLLLAKGVDLAGVNVMTMDYGRSRAKDQTMLAASESALLQTHRQLSVLYQRAGTRLNDASIWSKIGATPMIGQNDELAEVFTLDDAKAFNEFARQRGVGRMSMWSINRDVPCGSNYVDLKIVSDSCSGVKQEGGAFAVLLGNGFKGSLSLSAGLVTKETASSTTQKPDDPATSPYQIWSPEGAYLQGTKVVWHHNVYQAKWWTQGDVPDSPVLQAWETPWELIGPVLPGEKPVKQTTLPAGTFPEWSGGAAYDTGQQVLFKGVPYQSKWWNQGESPAAASSNPNSSPWVPLTQTQIDDIKAAKAE
ncbi:MAG TPA: chitinase [Candidatus Saccharimonadales bacterium]